MIEVWDPPTHKPQPWVVDTPGFREGGSVTPSLGQVKSLHPGRPLSSSSWKHVLPDQSQAACGEAVKSNGRRSRKCPSVSFQGIKVPLGDDNITKHLTDPIV